MCNFIVDFSNSSEFTYSYFLLFIIGVNVVFILVPTNGGSTLKKTTLFDNDNVMTTMQKQKEDEGYDDQKDVPIDLTQSLNSDELTVQHTSNFVHNPIQIYELPSDEYKQESMAPNDIGRTKVPLNGLLGQRILDSVKSDPLVVIPYSTLRLLLNDRDLNESNQVLQDSNTVDTENVSLNRSDGNIRERNNEFVSFPSPCPVCGDECTQYMAYGGRSCQSCRAFFRRSVKRFIR